MSLGASILIKTSTKVVSNAAASNTSPILVYKIVKKFTLNKKLVEEQIQSPHSIEPSVTDAAMKRIIPIDDLNIVNQKVDALESYSYMDVNGIPSCLNVPVVCEHDVNINVQLEMRIDEADKTKVDCVEGDHSHIDVQHDLQIIAASVHMEDPIKIKHPKSIQDETDRAVQNQTVSDKPSTKLTYWLISIGLLDKWDCRVFIFAYTEYLRHEKGILPEYFDAKNFRTRYASLLWQHGTQKNEIDAVSDDESLDRPVRPQF
ncbi:hypothetical protein CQW23_17162 [Capsicum baccatum]|uniref:Ubiquitin-like protease family profile domain-containing protein n=1 Tax=Capsicum baccatum TaxID=33114 RepID=A0A2G2WD37_CAPBA|nr:hypothetical protein CQW23_17162 [Capsicum baccatum]